MENPPPLKVTELDIMHGLVMGGGQLWVYFRFIIVARTVGGIITAVFSLVNPEYV